MKQWKKDKIIRLINNIEEIREAKRALALNGEQYSIQGSHSASSASLKELDEMETDYTRRLLKTVGKKRIDHAYCIIGTNDAI